MRALPDPGAVCGQCLVVQDGTALVTYRKTTLALSWGCVVHWTRAQKRPKED